MPSASEAFCSLDSLGREVERNHFISQTSPGKQSPVKEGSPFPLSLPLLPVSL